MTNEDIDRAGELETLRLEILAVTKKARAILRKAPKPVRDRAEAYWLPQLAEIAGPRIPYAGANMNDTIAELDGEEDED